MVLPAGVKHPGEQRGSLPPGGEQSLCIESPSCGVAQRRDTCSRHEGGDVIGVAENGRASEGATGREGEGGWAQARVEEAHPGDGTGAGYREAPRQRLSQGGRLARLCRVKHEAGTVEREDERQARI